MSVELLWWRGCPSTDRALELLKAALAAEGLDPQAVVVTEIETVADAERQGFAGSTTIRIGGRQVAPAEGEPAALTCRVYRLRDGRISPTPDPLDVRDAIRRTLR